jgi:hypothetical protein
LASTHYPQGDGITQRAIQNVLSKIRLYAEGLEDRYLDAVEKAVTAVNNNVNVTIGTLPRNVMTAFFNRKNTEGEKVYKQITTDVRRNILINQKKKLPKKQTRLGSAQKTFK